MELSIGLSNNNITESPRETHSLQCRRCGNGVGFCDRCQPDRTAKPRPRRPSSAPNSALAAEPPDAAATRLTITRWPEAANDAADERTEAAAAGTAAHGRTAAGTTTHGRTAAGAAAKNAADERTEAAATGRSDGTAAAPGWFGTAATDRHATESTGRLISPASVRLRASGDWGNSIPAIASAAINASS
jgi:hypothetical protein